VFSFTPLALTGIGLWSAIGLHSGLAGWCVASYRKDELG
jgi:hypothetical protein